MPVRWHPTTSSGPTPPLRRRTPAAARGFLAILCVFPLTIRALSAEVISLQPAVTSTVLRMDAAPLASAQPATPPSVVFDLQPLGSQAQVRRNLAFHRFLPSAWRSKSSVPWLMD